MTALPLVLLCSAALQDAGSSDPPLRPWTILIYGAADNDADGHMFDFLADVRAALADDPAVELVLFMDRSERYSKDAASLGEDFSGARLYRLRRSSAQRLAGGAEFPEIRLDSEYEADSADPGTLGKFLAFGKQSFPAQRYALLIYGHANGLAMCPDEESRREMGIAELTRAVSAAGAVDFLGLELCNMGGVEIAYQWRPGNGGFSTEVLLAIPNAGPPLDWRRIFGSFEPARMDARDLGRIAVEKGEEGRLSRAEEAGMEAAACYDLRAAAAVKREVDAFAAALSREPGGRRVMEELRRGALNYCGGRFQGQHAFIDLHDLLGRAAAAADLGEATRAAAQAAAEQVDALVLASFGMSGYPGFEPGRNGVFVVFPDGDAVERSLLLQKSRVWKKYRWYQPQAYTEGGVALGGWDWCRDGAAPGNGAVENWFELLDCWFDEAEGGGLNGYAY